MWQVVYSDPSKKDRRGRARRVRRHFVERDEAEKHLNEINRQLVVSGTSGVEFDHRARADYFAAREVLSVANLRDSMVDIARFYVQQLGTSTVAARDARAALAEFLKVKQAENRAMRAIQNLRLRVGAWLEMAAVTDVAEINREAAELLLMRKGVSAATRRNDLNAASSFCGWLESKGWLRENPVSRLRRPHVERARPAIWWAGEARAILDETARQAPEAVAGLVLLLFAGVRPSELAHCRVELAGEPCVRVEGGKTRGRANRTVPLSPNAIAWLKAYPAALYDVHRYWRVRIAKAAGVTWGQDTPRHTFISMRLAIKPDEGAVAREAGNSPDIIFRHYHRLVDEKAAKVFWGLRPGVIRS